MTSIKPNLLIQIGLRELIVCKLFTNALPLYCLETCRCEKRLSTNWRIYTPYVAPNQMGMLPAILNDFAMYCCKTCKDHGKSYVDWLRNGKNTSSKQHDDQILKEFIETTDLNFPVYGWTWQESYEGIYRFVDTRSSRIHYYIPC